MVEKKGLGAKVFDVCNHCLLVLIGIVCLYSFLYVVCPHTRFAGQKNNLYNGKG